VTILQPQVRQVRCQGRRKPLHDSDVLHRQDSTVPPEASEDTSGQVCGLDEAKQYRPFLLRFHGRK